MTSKTGARAPLSSHPLFPAVIALWFAALFGLSTLVLRTSLLEDAVRTLGVDLLIPAAAPPLGLAARILFALVCALCGGVLGYVLGEAARVRSRRGRAQRHRSSGKTPRWTSRRSASDYSAEAGLAEEDDNDDLARLAAARDLHAQLRRGLIALDEAAASAPVRDVLAPAVLSVADLTAVEPLQPGPPEPAHDHEATSPPVTLAPAAERMTPAASGWAAVARPGDAAQVLRAAPLDSLGMVELAERLALALAERRQGACAPREDVVVQAPWAETHEVFAAPLPAMLRPARPANWALPEWDEEAEEEPEEAALDGEADEEGDEDPLDDQPRERFGSLLNMRPSVRPALNPLDLPPHLHDGAGETDFGPDPDPNLGPEETEAALRQALAALQRISGAA